MTQENWGDDPRRAPMLKMGDTLLYSECGRIHGHVDYRSHYFRIVSRLYSGCFLLVEHGGGRDECHIDYNPKRLALIFDPLDSDARYLLMHMLYSVYSKAKRAGYDNAATEYKTAFVDGALRKRKLRGQNAVRVWIERTPTRITESALVATSEAF